jgi:hypothetical protein
VYTSAFCKDRIVSIQVREMHHNKYMPCSVPVFHTRLQQNSFNLTPYNTALLSLALEKNVQSPEVLLSAIWNLLSPMSYYNGFRSSMMSKQGTAGKRKHITLMFPQKLQIIRRPKCGESQQEIMAPHKTGSSIIYDVKKRKH